MGSEENRTGKPLFYRFVCLFYFSFVLGFKKLCVFPVHFARETLNTQLLVHFICLTLRDWSGGWNVWWWGWEEHEERRETTLRSGQTLRPWDRKSLEQRSMIHGLWVTSRRGDGPIPVWRYCWCLCQWPCINLFCQSPAPKISPLFPLSGSF